ncbi:hypothetical protein [Streptosporangium sp. NPDC004631]
MGREREVGPDASADGSRPAEARPGGSLDRNGRSGDRLALPPMPLELAQEAREAREAGVTVTSTRSPDGARRGPLGAARVGVPPRAVRRDRPARTAGAPSTALWTTQSAENTDPVRLAPVHLV